MKQEIWNELNQGEKARYILSQEIIVKAQTGIRGDAKPNDKDCFVTVYMAFAGGIILGQQHLTQEMALAEAATAVSKWRTVLEAEEVIARMEHAHNSGITTLLDALKEINDRALKASPINKISSDALSAFNIILDVEKPDAEIDITDAQVESFAASAQREVLGG